MRRLARGFLIAISIINGVSGLLCGVLLLLAPDGRYLGGGALLSVIRKLPLANVFFRDFTWIGIAMILALAIPGTVSAVLLLRRSPLQYVVSLVTAVLLMLWCGFELIFMYNVAALGYIFVGALSAVASVTLMRAS